MHHTDACTHSTGKCFTTLVDMFSNGLHIDKAQAKHLIDNIVNDVSSMRSSGNGNNTFYGGIFYYPDAPAVARVLISLEF